ncbi:hypothetical protein NP493_359g06029 [Ridgeia piscesae]|uniref:G-protein coupled receptors family 1 profile domain-containing protein n=1 Tax=Ridgeia piscesae TaxID=27915 RepID=A0AAD9J5L5_RIDPI|nr:hypothetical protein NP493_3661g00001 [Ridgeia piscesae]KAK2182267.1 hypothetical protein NP493_359g06029 [Ridgeia piscesae]
MEEANSVKVATICVSVVANVVLNGMVILVILRTPKLRSDRVTLFMLSLASSDLAFGVGFMTTSAIVCSHPHLRIVEDRHADIMAIVSTWLTVTSLYNICSVSVCKMAAVVYPLRYAITVTKRRCYLVIVFNWTASMLFAVPFSYIGTSWNMDMCFIDRRRINWKNSFYTIVVMVFGSAVPMCILVYANLRMFIVVARASRRVAAEGFRLGEVTNTIVLAEHTGALEVIRSVRSSRNIIVISLAYVLVVSPLMVVETAASFRQTTKGSDVEFAALWLFFGNTSINSLLYIVLHRSVRSAVKNVLSPCRQIAL